MHNSEASHDPPQTSWEQTELVHTHSKDRLGSPDTSGLGTPRCTTHFDLLNMVVSYKRMVQYLEPVADAVELGRFLLGWKMPVCSLLVCLLLNAFFCTVNEVGWFSVGVVAALVPAAFGYLQDRCGGRASDTELQRQQYHTVHRRDLQTVQLTRQEAMLEIKDLFYGWMLVVLCLLYIAPVGWMLAMLNSTIFLWNRDFFRGEIILMFLRLQRPHWIQHNKNSIFLIAGWLCMFSVHDLSPVSVEEAEEAEPDDEFKDAIEEDDEGPLEVQEYDTISENGLLSRNEPIRSKVSKLTEKLRKRYPTTSTGNCSGCSAVFSVLKKRRNCSNCGNSFCARCCSFKVLRACMGATAPEAQRETVFVCAACNSTLIKL
uniref:Protrudin n=1 Tax=Cynoglossus semilaevis TaxID=244447 RepID=A0A3P8VD05_CYNSE